MKNNFWSILSGRKSIRVQMIWAFIASIATSSVVSISIPIGLVFDVPVSVIVFIGTFAVSFMLFTRHTIKFMRTLSDGLTVISAGNLHHRIPTVRKDELGKVAEHINAMAEKLESLMEKERDAEKSKMELITGVSHDLRTPLTSIIGYLELLKEKGYRDEAEFERFIGNTHNKARQLKNLIDELFEYTRLYHSGAKLELETIDLKQMLIQMVAEIQPLAEEERIFLNLELPDRPLFMRMDPEQMRRAIDNLLMNALKFSIKPGVMRVSLIISDQSVMITVENDGQSISKEQETLLFDRFYKIDGSRSIDNLRAGAGLGLSITRGIAELHGGKAYLIHDAGHFKFGIELPCPAAFDAATK
ncbi:sensor histidine kinase [Cohnella lupini]|uniref:histidine kinase n=1 Tax=Cohnella lupini TaxID=1294267 RepID=A0A3D9I5T3_9BACL|nr:HAMP domain-containing sensor histidine kinase [Cohnella lupini]RED57137.1 signal transduction histidine kinase [Cohnella lupini]